MNFRAFFRQAQKGVGNLPQGGSGGAGAGVVGAVLAGGGVLAAANSLFEVEPGQNAIMFNRYDGVQDDVLNPGMHLMIPWYQTPTIYDTRSKPKVIRSPTGTRDLQMVDITVRLLYHPSVSHLPQIHRQLGQQYDDRVLPSIVNETLKSVVAQFDAGQLITRREEVSILIKNNLIQVAKDFHILVDDVSITHLTFGKEFTAAIEKKQIAQQQAEKAKYFVKRALEDKKSKIIKAQGQAESAKLIGEAIAKDPAYLEVLQMDAAQDIASIMAKSGNRLILDSNSLMLDLTKAGGGHIGK